MPQNRIFIFLFFDLIDFVNVINVVRIKRSKSESIFTASAVVSLDFPIRSATFTSAADKFKITNVPSEYLSDCCFQFIVICIHLLSLSARISDSSDYLFTSSFFLNVNSVKHSSLTCQGGGSQKFSVASANKKSFGSTLYRYRESCVSISCLFPVLLSCTSFVYLFPFPLFLFLLFPLPVFSTVLLLYIYSCIPVLYLDKGRCVEDMLSFLPRDSCARLPL